MMMEQLSLIKYSQIFDVDYYLRQLNGEEIDLIQTLDRNSGSDAAICHYINLGDKRRLRPHPLFDTDYYYEKNPDVETTDITALFHFLRYGWVELRNPHPMFDTKFVRDQMVNRTNNPLLEYINSPPCTFNPHPYIDEAYITRQIKKYDISSNNVLMALLDNPDAAIDPSPRFDTNRYLKSYPDVRENAEGMSALYHFLRYGSSEGRWALPTSASLKGIEKQINNICKIEPNVVPSHMSTYDLPIIFSENQGKGLRKTLPILADLIKKGKCDYIYFLSNPKNPRARATLTKFLRTHLSLAPDASFAILTTATAGTEVSELLPVNIDFIHVNLDSYGEISSQDGTLRFLAMVTNLLECRHIFLMENYIGWSLVEHHGLSLGQKIGLHGFAFPYDYDLEGRRAGYAWTHLRDCLPVLKSVITDDQNTVDQLERDLRLSEMELKKFAVIHNACPSEVLNRIIAD